MTPLQMLRMPPTSTSSAAANGLCNAALVLLLLLTSAATWLLPQSCQRNLCYLELPQLLRVAATTRVICGRAAATTGVPSSSGSDKRIASSIARSYEQAVAALRRMPDVETGVIDVQQSSGEVPMGHSRYSPQNTASIITTSSRSDHCVDDDDEHDKRAEGSVPRADGQRSPFDTNPHRGLQHEAGGQAAAAAAGSFRRSSHARHGWIAQLDGAHGRNRPTRDLLSSPPLLRKVVRALHGHIVAQELGSEFLDAKFRSLLNARVLLKQTRLRLMAMIMERDRAREREELSAPGDERGMRASTRVATIVKKNSQAGPEGKWMESFSTEAAEHGQGSEVAAEDEVAASDEVAARDDVAEQLLAVEEALESLSTFQSAVAAVDANILQPSADALAIPKASPSDASSAVSSCQASNSSRCPTHDSLLLSSSHRQQLHTPHCPRADCLRSIDSNHHKQRHALPCPWCHQQPNGVYPDHLLLHHPGRFFFRCSDGRLAEIGRCKEGEMFCEQSASCEMVSGVEEAAQTGESSPSLASPQQSDIYLSKLRATAAATIAPAGNETQNLWSRIRSRRLRGLAHEDGWQQEDPLPQRRALASLPNHPADINALLAFKERNLGLGGEFDSWDLNTNTNVCTWRGITCTSPTSGRVAAISFPADAPNPSLIAGKPSIGQSIPPEIGNLSELSLLEIGRESFELLLGGLIGSIPQELARCRKLRKLALQSQNLRGSIPDALSALTGLERISLNVNLLSGSIPSWLGSMTRITVLNLEYNQLTGTIPAEIGNLPNLLLLRLSSNQLTGTVPDSLSKLLSLQYLYLRKNQLSGPFPAALLNISSLGSLFLDNNQFHGPLPPEITTPPGLFYFISGNNLLSGVVQGQLIKSVCANSPSVMSLDLGRNNLSGRLPTTLGSCTALTDVDFSNNFFEGPIPQQWFSDWKASQGSIPTLALQNNSLTGSIPADFLDATYMTLFDVSLNKLTGRLPPISCTKPIGQTLGSLQVAGNNLEGPIPEGLDKNCIELYNVDLSNNSFSGAIPKQLLQCPVLLLLDLSLNNLSGPLPVPTKCQFLNQFSVQGNKLSGSFPTVYFDRCLNLSAFDASSNLLTGTLPQKFAKGGKGGIKFLNISRNLLVGEIPDSFSDMPTLSTIDVSRNNFSGTLNPSFTKLGRLGTLDLSHNQLQGSIPPEFGNFSAISNVSLAHNGLQGPLPQELATSRMLHHLRSFDVSFNKLSGQIPFGFENADPSTSFDFSNNNFSGQVPHGNLTALPSSAFANNSLCGGAGYPNCPEKNSSVPVGLIVGATIGGLVVVAALLGLLTWQFMPRRNEWTGGKMIVFERIEGGLTIDHILKATENFNDEKYRLGKGGFGTVYKATLPGGQVVAIKRLASESDQGEKEFEAEVNILGQIRHRNLVRLTAAFIGRPPSNQRLLLYNFLPGGSLDGILFNELGRDHPFLKWETRREIILGIALAMKYLHHDCQTRIIHRDMKPANVLLDSEGQAYVADFGLARTLDVKQTHLSTTVFGTVGYISPEYARNGNPSAKSDVFAFGVTILQILSGRAPTDEELEGRGMARWVKRNEALDVVDKRLMFGEKDIPQICGFLALGLQCCERTPVDRPTMVEVVNALQNL